MSPTSKTSANGLFDLDATMPAGATASQIPAMLQKVLADRFGLKVHRIQNETDGLALVVAADGPKFSQIDTAIPTRIAPNADGSTRVETSTIGNLLMLIGISLSQTPVDRTGLRAMYEIRVDLPGPASPLPAGMTLMRVAPSVEAVGRALETLGLRLEREKRLVDAVYVDHVELTPTTN
jgi:uncharacterized protein (TIGR03435 family)